MTPQLAGSKSSARPVVSPPPLHGSEPAGTTPASAQNRYQDQIRAQLQVAAQTVAEQGYVPAQEIVSGNLNQGARETMMVTLQGGGIYAIVGVCDEDCTDVDLRLDGPNGALLAEDIASDDTPVLEFVAPANGQYRLTVVMPGCSTAPCYWGVQLYQKR